ncbi:MAG: LamG-like jellyroll fold domain-containing protein, partial [Planctomycetota bacterium]
MSQKLLFVVFSVFLLGFVLSNTSQAADPDLLVWYKFDETDGFTASDSSGNGNDGALMGDPQWTALGQLGGALDFDGAGDYVEDADGESYLNGQTALTVSAWVKSRQINTDRGFLIGLTPTGGDRSVTMRYDSAGAGFGGDDVLKMAVSSSDLPGADGQQLESSAGLQVTDWQHYLMTWSSGGLIRFYVNGVEDTPTGRSNANTGGTSSECTTFIVGRGGKDDNATGEGWDGLIDDVRIYKRVLTLAEIQGVMLGTGGSDASNPSPADNAVDVPVDTDLSWDRGEYAIQDDVYLGTDPCMANLPKVATLFTFQDPLVDLPVDLVASTTYYWYVTETDTNMPHTPADPWQFATVRGETRPGFPPDGAVIPGAPLGDDIYTTLDFFSGATNVKWTGYFSDDYAEVSGRAQDANLGDPPYLPTLRYYAGLYAVPPAVDSLVRGTLYYWTVDGEDAFGNVFPGDIWEFAIQGYYAFIPDPPNEATFVSSDVLLSWKPGYGVVDHDVYMGTSYEAVRDARYDFNEPGGPAYVGPDEYYDTRSDANVMITGLPGDVKHYWRVDEVNGRLPPPMGGGTYYYGPVWNFTTMPEFPITDPNLLGWWKFELGEPTIAFDHSGHERHGTISGAMWTSPGGGGSDYCLGFDGTDDYIAIQNLSYTGTGYPEATVCAWINTTVGGDQMIASYDRNQFWRLEINGSGAGTGQVGWDVMTDTGQVDYGSITRVDDGQWHHVAGVFDNGTMTIYIDGKAEPSTTGGATFGSSATRYGFIGVGSEASGFDGNKGPTSYFNGYMDDVRIYDRALSAAEIRTIGAPPEAWAPSPYDGQVGVVSPVTLNWMPGKYAAKHDVYISTSRDLVNSRDAGAYIGRIDPNSFGPYPVTTGQVYYWTIDEVNDLGPDPGFWPGHIWVFRAEGGAGGLQGLYYHWDGYQPDNPLGPPNPFQIFVLSRIDPSVDFDWGNGTPDPNINIDYFACRWVGHVEAPMDANYTFYGRTDDGVRIFIDGQKLDLIDNTGAQVDSWRQGGLGAVGRWGASIVLSAGLHDIEMHQYEREGGAGADLRWSADPVNPADGAIPMQIIPPIWLWPPLFATGPKPPHLSTTDERKPALEWIPGLYALTHELYFSANFDDVNDRNPLIKQVLSDPCRLPVASALDLGRTYYWCVDEVKNLAERWNARTVWEFTINECISLDNFEDYNDRGELRVVWEDGYANVIWGGTYPFQYVVQSGSSGSNLNVSSVVGTPAGGTGPVRPTSLNYEAMVLRYDNDGWTYTGLPGAEEWVYDAPYFSEIEAVTVG